MIHNYLLLTLGQKIHRAEQYPVLYLYPSLQKYSNQHQIGKPHVSLNVFIQIPNNPQRCYITLRGSGDFNGISQTIDHTYYWNKKPEITDRQTTAQKHKKDARVEAIPDSFFELSVISFMLCYPGPGLAQTYEIYSGGLGHSSLLISWDCRGDSSPFLTRQFVN